MSDKIDLGLPGPPPRVEQGLIKMYLLEEEPRGCMEPRCERRIEPLGQFFLCTLSNRIYCENCGPPIRYHRRKAVERGEEVTADTGIDE